MRKLLGFATAGMFLLCPAPADAKHRVHRFVRTVPCASSPLVAVQVVNAGAMPAADLEATETALVVQANTQLCVHWHSPRIWFTTQPVPGAIRMTLVVPGDAALPPGFGGMHGVSPVTGIPDLWVWPLSKSMSHELMETLVDGSGSRVFGGWLAEVADPVNTLGYMIAGVRVADFVYPSWFRCHASGPWDYLHRTFAPLDVEGGNEIWVNPDGTMTGTIPDNYGC